MTHESHVIEGPLFAINFKSKAFTYMTFGLAFLVFDTIRLMVLSDFAIKQCPRTQLTAAIQL